MICQTRFLNCALILAALLMSGCGSELAEVTGIVTLVDWRNPHVHIFLNVRDPKGTLNWAVEIESRADRRDAHLSSPLPSFS